MFATIAGAYEDCLVPPTGLNSFAIRDFGSNLGEMASENSKSAPLREEPMTAERYNMESSNSRGGIRHLYMLA